nr:uncharacterized protein LOC105865779 [Microcebus murinus]
MKVPPRLFHGLKEVDRDRSDEKAHIRGPQVGTGGPAGHSSPTHKRRPKPARALRGHPGARRGCRRDEEGREPARRELLRTRPDRTRAPVGVVHAAHKNYGAPTVCRTLLKDQITAGSRADPAPAPPEPTFQDREERRKNHLRKGTAASPIPEMRKLRLKRGGPARSSDTGGSLRPARLQAHTRPLPEAPALYDSWAGESKAHSRSGESEIPEISKEEKERRRGEREAAGEAGGGGTGGHALGPQRGHASKGLPARPPPLLRFFLLQS